MSDDRERFEAWVIDTFTKNNVIEKLAYDEKEFMFLAWQAAKDDVSGEPVAWEYTDWVSADYEWEKGHWSYCRSVSKSKPCGDSVKDVVPLYTSPPQSQALVAAAFRKAQSVLLECEQNDELHNAEYKIGKLTPADAEKSLRGMILSVIQKAWAYGLHKKADDIADMVIRGE